MSLRPIDELPGYRRRFLVTAGPGWARSDLEDEVHHMHVTLRHEDGVVTAVEPVMERWPWTTCPEAGAALQRTFVGLPLTAFAERGDKPFNCTHLHDLALLAAAHARDAAPLAYDVLVSDPVEGRQRAELRRNGETVLSWVMQHHGPILEPAELAGTSLRDMRAWMDGLDAEMLECARVLRWGAMVSHGRQLPLSQQSDATVMAPRCYTFQPQNAVRARRFGKIHDFNGRPGPLAVRTADVLGESRRGAVP